MTCTEASPDHNNGTGTATIEAAQDDPIQHTKDTDPDPAITHYTSHTTNHPHTAAHQVPLTQMIIDTSDSDPVLQKSYPIVMKHYKWVKDEINKLLTARVIRRS